jgi:hypothetical protein
MTRCDALISGSFALQFFDRVVWSESDLDIYVQHSRLTAQSEESDALAQYLVSVEGYALDRMQDVTQISYHDKLDIDKVRSKAGFTVPESGTKLPIDRYVYES